MTPIPKRAQAESAAVFLCAAALSCLSLSFLWKDGFLTEQMTDWRSPAMMAELLAVFLLLQAAGAFLRDPASLSYIYKVKEDRWLMMLDSAIYAPENRVVGRIRPETLAWMEQCFQEAQAAGARVIPVAHHNLLYESKLFRRDCTLEN